MPHKVYGELLQFTFLYFRDQSTCQDKLRQQLK